MNLNELPKLSSHQYASATLGGAELMKQWFDHKDLNQRRVAANAMAAQQVPQQIVQPAATPAPIKETPKMTKPVRRLVQVFICDPDDNVPLSDSLLYTGDQQLTDLTDQELFFEIDIKTILAAHNEKRTKLTNKAIKERTELLEPARVRDLKMTVVNIATF